MSMTSGAMAQKEDLDDEELMFPYASSRENPHGQKTRQKKERYAQEAQLSDPGSEQEDETPGFE